MSKENKPLVPCNSHKEDFSEDMAVGQWRIAHEFIINPPGEFMAMEAILATIARRFFPNEKDKFGKLEDLNDITLRPKGVSLSLVMPTVNFILQHGNGNIGLHVIHQFDFAAFAKDCNQTILESFSKERAEISLTAIGDRPDMHQLVVAQMLAHPNCRYDHRRPTIWDIAKHLKKGDSIIIQLDATGLKDHSYKVGGESKIRYTAIATGIDIDKDGEGFVYVNLPGASATPQFPEAHFLPLETHPIEIKRFMELWCMDGGNSMPFYALGIENG